MLVKQEWKVFSLEYMSESFFQDSSIRKYYIFELVERWCQVESGKYFKLMFPHSKMWINVRKYFMAFPHHIFCFLLKSSFTFLVQFEFLLVPETVLNMKYFEMCNKSKAEGCDFALKFNRCQRNWMVWTFIYSWNVCSWETE